MTPSGLIDAVRAFVESLSAEKGYSIHTCRAYRRDLEEFTAYLDGNAGGPPPGKDAKTDLGPNGVTPLMIRGYLGYLHQKNQKSSVARKLSTLRSFFKSLVKKGLIEANPAEGLLTPKREKTIPVYLTVDEIFRLLDSIESDALLAARNRAIFETLYSCGIRVSELTGLDVFDLDASAATVRVFGKGGKERVVPIGRKALAPSSYRERLRAETGIGADRNGPLFINRQRQRLTARSVGRILKQSGGLRHRDPDFAPRLRHTFATHMLDAGSGPAQRAELLAPEPFHDTEVHPREHRLADGNLR
jgi:integrase/recombinase XerC